MLIPACLILISLPFFVYLAPYIFFDKIKWQKVDLVLFFRIRKNYINCAEGEFIAEYINSGGAFTCVRAYPLPIDNFYKTRLDVDMMSLPKRVNCYYRHPFFFWVNFAIAQKNVNGRRHILGVLASSCLLFFLGIVLLFSGL